MSLDGIGALAELVCGIAGVIAGGLRWLRVAQREHYVVGAATRFARRWWQATPAAVPALIGAVVALLVSLVVPVVGVMTGAVVVALPRRLTVRGRTSRLAWTRRLTTLAVAAGLIGAVLVAAGGALSVAVGTGVLRGVALGAGLAALLTPLLVDVAQWVLSPLERRSAGRYVATATKRLQEVAPIVVGITGSYGKTSTKGYITALVAGDRRVVASPRSFNNRAGLARTVNDYLPDGTEVLVAEMGTYGPGEIAALCSWMPPRIAVLTAIGPVHLERFGSLDRILAAKAEIAIEAELVVCNVDDERLARLAAVLASQGKRVIGASAGAAPGAEVVVTGSPPELRLVLRGVELGTVRFEAGAWPTGLTNVACAVAVADELGVPGSKIMSRLSGLPVAANRLEWLRAPSGTIVLDDTFNSNPAGARRALEALERAAPAGPAARVVVTPGMVELGTRQFDENAQFGELAGRVASHLVIVGRTNRAALVAGARRAPGANVVLVDDRAEAVAWVRRELGEGTAVLYENDLPDHFP